MQWHFRAHGNTPSREPVLKRFENIVEADAVLAYEKKELVTDEQAKPITRWDGKTTKKHPVTGEDVPDESARVPVYRFVNPAKADWLTKDHPRIDYVIGNPPFIGNKRMVSFLSSEYSSALRDSYPEVPESADLVMYWWEAAARLLRAGKIKRFGLIITSSITQSFNRRVVATHLDAADAPLSIVFAIGDHPWVDSADGAAVRIAMTVAIRGKSTGSLGTVTREESSDGGGFNVELATHSGFIHEDLRIGADVASAKPLKANADLCGQGMKLVGDFFAPSGIAPGQLSPTTGLPVIRSMIAPSDVLKGTAGGNVIDFFELTVDQARTVHPTALQRVVDHVKPLRDQNRRDSIRELWWRFAWERPVLRSAIRGLHRYFVTLETAKYRIFTTASPGQLWDGSLFAIATDDWSVFGVLSSRAHTLWAVRSGAMLGPTPRYNRSQSFEAFPFPQGSDVQKSRIRALGEQLDAHRKRQQAAHPGLTITDMYNVLAKLRTGEALSAKDKKVHEEGLVSVLKQIHDDLDAAVFDAYGWPATLGDEEILERLVALNAERAAEEKRGLIRWLRPEFQMSRAGVTGTEEADDGADDDEASSSESRKKTKKRGEKSAKDAAAANLAAATAKKSKPAERPWPKSMADQARAIREALSDAGPARPPKSPNASPAPMPTASRKFSTR